MASPQKPELLAPAGDWECLKAAVTAGADAVYFGLPAFNARLRAENLPRPTSQKSWTTSMPAVVADTSLSMF